MSEPNRRYYTSPVDYEAWGKGYMPPSEHILMHKLHTGEVRVLAATEINDIGWWIAYKGKGTLSRSKLKALRELLDMDVEMLVEQLGKLPEPNVQPDADGAPVAVPDAALPKD